MQLFDEPKPIRPASLTFISVRRFFALLLGCLLTVSVTSVQAQAQIQSAASASRVTTNAPSASMNANAAASMQDTNANTRILTLQQCIKLALEHNLDIQIQQYNPLIDRYALNAVYGVYEPVLSFTGSKNYNDTPGGLNPATGLPFAGNVREADTYTPQIQGVLPTGMTYDFTGSLSRNSVQTNGPGAYYASPFWTTGNPGPGVSLTQPLLKNFWIDSNRLAIQLDKATLKISQQAVRFQIMSTVTAVKSNYYNLLYARGNVEANATAYKLAMQLVQENLKREEVGTLAPLDEKQSESQAAASLAAMQAAQQALLIQQNTLKNLLTDNYSEWAGVVPLPADQLVAIPEPLNLQESWRRAVTQRPDLEEAKLRVEAQNVTLKYNLNQIFPELDLVGSYGRNAYNDSFNDALGDLRQGNYSYYSYGAFVSIPLGGNYGARNNYKSAKATLKQLLLTLKQAEQTIIVAVDNDVGAVRSSLQQVYATRDARIYAEDALAAEQKKLENGKSTSFIILQLISNLTTAKVAELQALANYNIAVAQLDFDEGNTLAINHIDLKVK